MSEQTPFDKVDEILKQIRHDMSEVIDENMVNEYEKQNLEIALLIARNNIDRDKLASEFAAAYSAGQFGLVIDQLRNKGWDVENPVIRRRVRDQLHEFVNWFLDPNYETD